ncbi:hypothetical protein G7Y89_g15161 [Cudoniella acicularis]|uniref:SprT-like domain-containing protein n=1 Tax=Cudoniella acicularis TaxID=354080 RepID=A0A8H4QS69_9HELO|nr:hypothetical protein G7Y89_g15161 [Cudoniella acicularis]
MNNYYRISRQAYLRHFSPEAMSQIPRLHIPASNKAPFFGHHAEPNTLRRWLEGLTLDPFGLLWGKVKEHCLFIFEEVEDPIFEFLQGDIDYRRLILKRSFEIFDRVFFANTLHRHCSLETCDPEYIEGEHGLTVGDHDDLDINGQPYIFPGYICAIFISKDQAASNSVNPYRPMLQTLLHEMLHAFFVINACRCPPFCEKKYFGQLGQTGHGISWGYAAFFLEKAMNERFGPYWDLNRAVSFAREYDANPSAYEIDEWISRWALNSSAVEKFLARREEARREEADKLAEEEIHTDSEGDE